MTKHGLVSYNKGDSVKCDAFNQNDKETFST